MTAGLFWVISTPSATGRKRSKQAPDPGALSHSIHPSCSWTMPNAVDSPRPVPLSTSLVVKNGSKIRLRVSSSMPGPLSHTRRRRYVPATASAGTFSTASSSPSPSIRINGRPSPQRPHPRRRATPATACRTDLHGQHRHVPRDATARPCPWRKIDDRLSAQPRVLLAGKFPDGPAESVLALQRGFVAAGKIEEGVVDIDDDAIGIDHRRWQGQGFECAAIVEF